MNKHQQHYLINRAASEQTPLIDSQKVTFLWQGTSAPVLMTDFSDWIRADPIQLHQIDPGIWVYETYLPDDAYLEYSFYEDGKVIRDPFNPRLTPNGIGATNHYFYMPGAKPTDLIRQRRNVQKGRIIHLQVETMKLIYGSERTVHLYQPAVEHACPLIVVWDGGSYLRRARLPVILDNLIADKRIHPVALAMIDSNPKSRITEYMCSEASLTFLLHKVLPLASNHLNLLDLSRYPGSYGVLGASLGGVIALFSAIRHPDIFGQVLTQSGAFGYHGYDMVVFDLIKAGLARSLRIWLDVGIYDFRTIIERNANMYQKLTAMEYDVRYDMYHAGHNYPAWRDQIWRGLEYCYGAQLDLGFKGSE